MKSYHRFILFLALVLGTLPALATHYRAGEILFVNISPLVYQVTIITYTKVSYPSNLADRDSVQVDWGDGSSQFLYRSNGPIDANGFPGGVLVLTDVQKNEYTNDEAGHLITHSYPGVPPGGVFVVSFVDDNRMDDILNINGGNSVDIPFCVVDSIFFPVNQSFLGLVSSPVLENPAVQYAALCDTFYTNPDAVDSAGDSMDYQLAPCLQAPGAVVPFYLFPDAFCRSEDINCGAAVSANSFIINRKTGDVTWADPCLNGIYNVDIMIHIFRNGFVVGSMLRDMQIIVIQEPHGPPELIIPPDTCIRAGNDLIEGVSASAVSDSVILTAGGEPFHVTNEALFGNNDTAIGRAPFGSSNASVNATFRWTTDCDNIQEQPYQVFFKAENGYSAIGPDGTPAPYHLQNFKTWSIQVIPPPVQNLRDTLTHNGVTLTWQDPYSCATAPNFRGFSVWRKVGCDPFVPSYCETGLAGTGYVEIALVDTNVYAYTDNTVVPGQTYSYRVLAEFYSLPPNNDTLFRFNIQESVPSAEVCINAPVDVPVILNADVIKTDAANGQIYIRWAKPLAGSTNLDTIVAPPVYRFDLYHNQGQNFNANTSVLLQSFTFQTYSSIPDTVSIIDSSLNTVASAWSYKVYFFANSGNTAVDTIGASAPASSTYLSISPTDQTLNLHWTYNVPWTNDSFTVYRQNHVTGIYDSIGIAYTPAYSDTGLQNDTTYCYYVKGWGYYGTDSSFPSPLINRSQTVCNAPIDTVAPCAPMLKVTNDCGQYTNVPWNTTQYVNYLIWNNNTDSCALTVTHYRIYYNPSDSTNFTLIDSTTSRFDTTYNHVMNDNLAGCYAVTAVDIAGNQSAFSNIVCVDNCPYYVLPNAFTPNGDGHNDVFHPFLPYRFVPKIEMKIYNRWGELVFETTDPYIGWNGTDKSGNKVSDGIYLYSGYYYEQHLNGLVRKPLSGEKKGGGFIQVITK